MTERSLSIIIVNYKVTKELLLCIKSIKKFFGKIKYEIIVVENDPSTDISKKLLKYKNLKYLKAKGNMGFGAGCNFGAKYAKGEFLFFLNPDTEILGGEIQKLLSLFNDPSTGAVSPLLLDKKGTPYDKQGTMKLTPISAFFSQTFAYKYFPDNFVANGFWLRDWDKKTLREVDVIPGTAFLIRKNLFDKIRGFDENFFLYFEENDLCNRIKDKGFKNYISPELKVMHKWGESTKQRSDTYEIFRKSRRYYFKKNFGTPGVITDLFLSIKLRNK